jgi:glutamate racemase
MKIGFFDSGVAGLAVIGQLQRVLASHDMVYFADTAHFPYGIKSPAAVAGHLVKGLGWLVDQGCQRIGIVCGSASSVIQWVPETKVPLIDIITPAVGGAMALSAGGRIGVLASRMAVETRVFDRLIKPNRPGACVSQAAAPLLAALVMEGWYRRPEARRVIKKYLYPLKRSQIDTLIVATSHGLIVSRQIREKIGRRVNVVDTGRSFIERMTADLPGSLPARSPEPSCLECWLTDTNDHFKKMGAAFYKGRIIVRQAPGL